MLQTLVKGFQPSASMESTAAERSECLALSPLDQIMPRVYSRIILPIPFKDMQTNLAVENLRQGLMATVTETPLLKGTVVLSARMIGRVEVIIKVERTGRACGEPGIISLPSSKIQWI